MTVVTHATTVHHNVSFKKIKIDTLVADDGNVYSAISLNDCIISSTEGSPNLPRKIITLIIPADQEADKIVLTKGKGKMISLTYPVISVQKPIPTSLDFEGNDFVIPDKTIYDKNEFYPLQQARILRTNKIRGNKVVVVEVAPVFYNPVLGQLEYFESIDVNLHLKSSTKKLKKSKVKNKEKYDNYLKALVDNKADVDLYSVIEEQDTISSEIELRSILPINMGVHCEYVIITPSSLAPYFYNFIKWKRQKGIDVELVTTENIYANYYGDEISGIYDNAGKIRQFLSDSYDYGLEYALLGGDNTKVAIRYGAGSPVTHIPESIIPTDLYYSDFDGDWEVDNDLYYGEAGPSSHTYDDVDYGSEIFVGRILVNSGAQIQAWTNKLILYEKNPGYGSTSYLTKALYSEADDMQKTYPDFNPIGMANDIAQRFSTIYSSRDYIREKVDGISDPDSDVLPDYPTGNEVISKMNSGYGFVSWANHANARGVGFASKGLGSCDLGIRVISNVNSNSGSSCGITESANGLDNLTNSSKPFILYTLGCETTPFDTWKGITPTTNLGAQITNQSGKGGPIFLGNTRHGYSWPSWYLQQEFTSLIVGGTYQLGAAEANSKGVAGEHHVWLAHNLIGCPETEIWTDTPSEFYGAYVSEFGGNLFVSTGSVSGCRICVMSASDNGVSYYRSVTQNYPFMSFFNVPKPYVVTITKHNYIPYVNDGFNLNKNQENGYSDDRMNPLENQINVYPNPVKSGNINFENLNFDDLIIYDETGRFVQSINVEGLKLYQLNVSKFQNGIYYYELKGSDSDSKSGKFIVE